MELIDSRPAKVLVVAPRLLAWSIGRIVDDAQPRLALAGCCAGLAEARQEIERTAADVAVLLVDGEDPRQLAAFCADSPAKVLVLTASPGDPRLDAAVRAGLRGVLALAESACTLVRAIDRVRDGELWIDRSATSRIFLRIAKSKAQSFDDLQQGGIATLTVRERQTVAAVARHVAAPGKVIADRLRISEHTLRNHLSSIYGKLGLSSRLDLYAYATRHKLCPPE